MAQVLPRSLQFTPAATMPQARSYLFKQNATDSPSSVDAGGWFQIDIPRLQRSYLTKDSYIKFKFALKYTAGTDNTKVYQRNPFDTSGIHTDGLGYRAVDGYASLFGVLDTVTATEYPAMYCNADVSETTGTDIGKVTPYIDFAKYIACFDTPGALGLFNTIEVYDYLGSTLLERTEYHGELMATLLDTSVSNNTIGTHYGSTIGTRAGPIVEDNTVAPLHDSWMYIKTPTTVEGETLKTPATVYPNTAYKQIQPVTGQILNCLANDSEDTYYFEYAVPLLSFLGSLSTKYAPLHNGYTIKITLNTLVQALGICDRTDLTASIASADASYSISDISYHCQILELSPTAEAIVLSSTQNMPMVVPTKAFRHYNKTVKAGRDSDRLALNINVASLTNILWIMRQSSLLNDARFKCLSSHIRNNLMNWSFEYGSSTLPISSGIYARAKNNDDLDKNGYVEAYSELMKSRHNFSVDNVNTLITDLNYKIDTNSGFQAYLYPVPKYIDSPEDFEAAVETPRFAAGLDLELISGKSNEIVSGLNTNGMNTAINLRFSSAGSAVETQLDCWCEYDAFISVSPGVATTVSF